MQLEDIAWAEKFRPNSLKECFLPQATETVLREMIKEGNLPNMIFSGSAGIGKTTVAIALMKELGSEYIKINSSMQGNIDTLRNEIHQFASTVSFNGNKKYIILDEADWLTIATQAALRGFIDEYSKNAGFILTANFRNKISEPILSRLTEVSFSFTKQEKPELAKKLYAYLITRCKEEDIEYEDAAIKKYIIEGLSKSSDIRQMITQAQIISKTGVFNLESLLQDTTTRFNELFDAIKSKNFELMRKWVGENSDIEPSVIFRNIYDNIKKLATEPMQIAQCIIILNEHQFKHAFVVDKEINLVSCVAELAGSV